MLDAEAEGILRDLLTGNYILTAHARFRMQERGVKPYDIREIGRTWVSCDRQSNGRYRIEGYDMSGDPICIICTPGMETVIITVIED